MAGGLHNNLKNNLQWYSSIFICIRPVFLKKEKNVMCVYSVNADKVRKCRPRGLNAQRHMVLGGGTRIQAQA